MSTFSYKSGGRSSRYLSDYRDQTVGSLNVSYTIDDWWEELDQTITIAETSVAANNYGNISQYGSHGIACRVKGSGAVNDNQVSSGTILIVGGKGPLRFSGTARAFPINVPYTSINCSGGICVYSYESGVVSDTVGLHGPSTVLVLGNRTIGSFTSVRDHQSLFRFNNVDESRTYVYDANVVDEWYELDYGLITNSHTTTEDNGNITDLDQVTRHDYGYIWRLRTERAFGFVKTVGEAQARATNAWVGEGKITIFSKQKGANFYGYIVDGKVRSFQVLGTADANYSPAPKGRGIIPLSGNVLESFDPAGEFLGGTLFAFAGAAESATFNPQEKQMLFSFTGEGHCSNTDIASGSGNLFAFSGLSESTLVSEYGKGLFALGGTGKTHYVPHVEGTGRIPVFEGAAECLTFNPTEEQILFSVNGLVTEKHTEVYVGSGRIRKLSGAAESIRWAAQHTTGLYKITGNGIDTRSRDFVGFGSLRKLSGASESLTFNPLEKDLLFSFVGERISEKHTESYVGSGRIRNLATLEAEKAVFDYVGSGSLNLYPRKPEIYQLSQLGNFTLDYYSLQNAYINLGYLEFYNQALTNLAPVQLKWLNLEEGHEKHTETYNNSACEEGIELDYGFIINQSASLSCVEVDGTISSDTTATTGCTKVAPGTILAIAPPNTYTIPVSNTTPTSYIDHGLVSEPNFNEREDYGHILDSLSKVCPYGAFEVAGTATTFFVENIVSTGISVSGRATINIFGAGGTFWTPPYYGSGFTKITGTLAESFTPTTHIGSGVLYAFSGAAESTSIGAVSGGLFKFGGDGYTLFSLQHFGSGGFKLSGDGTTLRTRLFTGSGSLKKFSGAAESATFNPLEKQMLFSFLGEGIEKFVANPPEEGAEIRLSGTTTPELLTFAEQPFGRIPISGVGGTDRTRVFIGSGSLKKFSGAAESITFNPEEKQLLFSFTGSATEKVTANPPEEGTQIRISGEAIPKVRVHEVVFGTIPISGDAVFKKTKPFIGSGSLKKFSGAAESITVNPLEKQLLFSFTGRGIETRSSVEIASGRLFTFSSSTVVSGIAYETSGLFKVSGIARAVQVPRYKGSGSFKKFSGAAESLTVNPDERQLLFSFVGERIAESKSTTETASGGIKIYPEASDIRFIPNWNSVGGIKINIDGEERFSNVYIGSGSFKKFSGASESLTINPTEEQMLFSFTGEGVQSRTSREISKGGTLKLSGDARIVLVPNNIGSGTIFVTGDADTVRARDFAGSGSLRKLSGAAESRRIDITTLPSLFRVYGDGDIARSRPYIGSGSLKKFSGSAESATFNPDEEQMLFSFLGQATTTRARDKVGQGTVKTLGDSVARFSPVHIGSGTTKLTGEVYVTRSRDFVGFGSLRKLSGAAESLTFNPLEKQMLFSFIGEGVQARTSKLISQGGTLAIRGTSGDPLLTFAEEARVEIDITGDSIDLRTHAYQGSGRIRNLNSLDESFVRDGYEGSGTVTISGIALVQVQLFQPPFTQVWII